VIPSADRAPSCWPDRIVLGAPTASRPRNRSVSACQIVGLGEPNPQQEIVRANLHWGTALETLRSLPDRSVHLCVTDPPYFIEGLGAGWHGQQVSTRQGAAKLVGGLPAGMKFDPRQGPNLHAFMLEASLEIIRILKPGGFYISFAQPRLYHRLATAVEDAGFELRDMLIWARDGQAKAFSQDHFVRKLKITDQEKERIIDELGGRRTPQLRPQMEPMTLAQKPRDGTFVDNWMRHRTGLMDTTQTLDGMFPGNIMPFKKPTRAEKGADNDHPTSKPVPLIDHIIRLFSAPGQTVLDPFLGSGSHGVAALQTGRNFIGIERDSHYYEIAKSRIREAAGRCP
jgi:site-specific DNA-methyltransferase (adenine-specific)